MSKEEQEAIDILKRTIKNSNYCDSIGTGQIEIVLNYIDKLQKELKEEIKDLIKENHKHIDYIANMKKKHEDKIRTKIKELERCCSNEPIIIEYQIEVLRELLGETKDEE